MASYVIADANDVYWCSGRWDDEALNGTDLVARWSTIRGVSEALSILARGTEYKRLPLRIAKLVRKRKSKA